MTCLRSPRVAELRFDPSHLCSLLPSSRRSQRRPGRVTPGHLTLGRDPGPVVRGSQWAGACGRWQALWHPHPPVCCAVLSLGSVHRRCGPAVFYPSREGAWAGEVGAQGGGRLAAGSLFSLSWVLVSLL